MPRIKRYTFRLSFHVTPQMREWFENRSVAVNRPASELYREALEKYATITDLMESAPQGPPEAVTPDKYELTSQPEEITYDDQETEPRTQASEETEEPDLQPGGMFVSRVYPANPE